MENCLNFEQNRLEIISNLLEDLKAKPTWLQKPENMMVLCLPQDPHEALHVAHVLLSAHKCCLALHLQ